MYRRYYGATTQQAKKPVVYQPKTVTRTVTAAVNLAAQPVRWGLRSAGALVRWAGGTLQNLSNKL